MSIYPNAFSRTKNARQTLEQLASRLLICNRNDAFELQTGCFVFGHITSNPTGPRILAQFNFVWHERSNDNHYMIVMAVPPSCSRSPIKRAVDAAAITLSCRGNRLLFHLFIWSRKN
jgi:hypothetical protein